MLIRKCVEEDLEKILEIEEKSFEYPYSRGIFEDFLSSDFFLLAEEDSTIFGYILAEAREEDGVIVSIAVLPGHRLQGVGTSLMEEVQKRMDVKRFFLIVRESNRGAQIFYDKLGFSKITRIEDYYQNDEDGILMQKPGKKKIN
ncbi:MAG: ribosomal protein S18-alanine N-acetyltransferase [Candidatus Thermoplasmatota archaeon]|nr:ribosomal protein S18-alanine N-acetyltransferase [Candidatus Thermoplasmatota archaeon]MBS3790177.1 ribosomal protein S18-alanine N-acetyltransferase [Candidatus Thermoplasmatota archaeon]